MESQSERPAIILFAHGARDARWAEPFVRVAERVRNALPARTIQLAYLESLAPDLPEAARRLAVSGATAIRVIPLFFGRGGHLRDAVPRLIDLTARAFPDITFELADAAGEDPEVIAAIAAFCVRTAEGRDGAKERTRL